MHGFVMTLGTHLNFVTRPPADHTLGCTLCVARMTLPTSSFTRDTRPPPAPPPSPASTFTDCSWSRKDVSRKPVRSSLETWSSFRKPQASHFLDFVLMNVHMPHAQSPATGILPTQACPHRRVPDHTQKEHTIDCIKARGKEHAPLGSRSFLYCVSCAL